MLLIDKICQTRSPATERLVLPYEARCKSRLRAQLESGEEVGLFLEPGTVLRGGDKLQGQDGRVVEVVAAPEKLMEVWSASLLKLARIAYHLGNRHMAIQLGEGWIRFPTDHVLRDMVIGLGADVAEVTEPFEPESGAYAHRHAHGDGAGGARIHQYRRAG